MPRERVLITVKTYPTLSQTHIELVCTAGLRADGSWVRIYPVPFRLLEHGRQFPKWTWVEMPLVRRTKDHRPESHSPSDRNDIQIFDTIGTADGWRERRDWALKRGRVWHNLKDLIAAGKAGEASLATFKPARLLGLDHEPAQTEWDTDRLAHAQEQLRQTDLFETDAINENFKPADKVPHNFYYRFRDEAGTESRMRILDWEIGMLYWNCLKLAHGDQDEALLKVRQKYEQQFFSTDLHLFLGTTLEWHDRAPNPWVIIGVFPAPHQLQGELF
jgi:hypothetical protein